MRRQQGCCQLDAFALVSVAEDARFELARGCPQHAFQHC